MTFAKYMAKHYYITSFLIVVTFGYSFVMAIIRRTTERSERQFRADLEATLLHQTVRIQNLQTMLDNKIQKLEDNQEKILKILQELKDAVRPPS